MLAELQSFNLPNAYWTSLAFTVSSYRALSRLVGNQSDYFYYSGEAAVVHDVAGWATAVSKQNW